MLRYQSISKCSNIKFDGLKAPKWTVSKFEIMEVDSPEVRKWRSRFVKMDGQKVPEWTVRKFLRVKIDGLKECKWTVSKFLRVSYRIIYLYPSIILDPRPKWPFIEIIYGNMPAIEQKWLLLMLKMMLKIMLKMMLKMNRPVSSSRTVKFSLLRPSTIISWDRPVSCFLTSIRLDWPVYALWTVHFQISRPSTLSLWAVQFETWPSSSNCWDRPVTPMNRLLWSKTVHFGLGYIEVSECCLVYII